MELISWIATFFVLISFFFDGKVLRILNGIGAVLWLIWGIEMEEGAVMFLNAVILGIHAYKLSIEKKMKNLFSTSKNFLKNRHGI